MAESDWHPNGIAAFFKSDYTFDDAKKLSELWNIPLRESKQVLGHKVINNIEHLLPQEVNPPKIDPEWNINSLTAFFKSDYAYEDAKALADMWNIGVVEAKQALGHKIINNIQDLLPSGLQNPNSKVDTSLGANFQAYVKSEYDYDDAVLLATLWSLGVPEAKNEIGYHVLQGTDTE